MKTEHHERIDNDQLSGWTKKKLVNTPNVKTALRKVMATLWCSAAGIIHYNFLSPRKTITPEKAERLPLKSKRTTLTWARKVAGLGRD
ncbi:hypothetical protein KIN20_037555 [Parelaphostrongylus tenuis]|uniref:Transposase n=1 Tax=Parelaphostrongylus tenuis TaxID=148309 RepID=A0AAD5RES9_PARTN|nr:hypothetical protein KIN20_037555 [Parelaphostrongylus tenuis]